MSAVRKTMKLLAGPSWFLTKLVAYLVVTLIFCVSVYVLAEQHEMKLLTQFQALREVDPIPRAEELARAGEYCEALEYLDYFRDYDYVKNDPRVTKLYDEIREKREAYLFVLKDVWSGVWRGKGACMESLVSATVSDFFVVGDVRDLVWGLLDKYYGRETSDFTIALASIGVLLTGVTVVLTPTTAGAAAPAGVSAKVSVSLLKLAKKMGKLPKSLQRSLVRVFRRCTRLGSLKPLRPVSRSIYSISKVKGLTIRDFLTIISRCKNIRDIKVMERVTKVFGKHTGKFLKLGGDAPVKVAKRFGKSKNVTEAMNTAVKYGPDGTRLLVKTGPTKFIKYLKIAKYGVRTTRTIWQHRLTLLLAGLISMLPAWAMYGITALSGLGAVGAPAVYARNRLRRRKERAVA
jgi:hypothetical protein